MSETLPLTAVRISPEAVRAFRRRVGFDPGRQRDLDRAFAGVLYRDEALAIVVRMVARAGQTYDEKDAVRRLKRRHNLTTDMIVRAWRASRGKPTAQDLPPGLLGR